ncbi:MAG: hypothetical protein ACK4P5_02730 [Fimbriimonadales bacterium]
MRRHSWRRNAIADESSRCDGKNAVAPPPFPTTKHPTRSVGIPPTSNTWTGMSKPLGALAFFFVSETLTLRPPSVASVSRRREL